MDETLTKEVEHGKGKGRSKGRSNGGIGGDSTGREGGKRGSGDGNESGTIAGNDTITGRVEGESRGVGEEKFGNGEPSINDGNVEPVSDGFSDDSDSGDSGIDARGSGDSGDSDDRATTGDTGGKRRRGRPAKSTEGLSSQAVPREVKKGRPKKEEAFNLATQEVLEFMFRVPVYIGAGEHWDLENSESKELARQFDRVAKAFPGTKKNKAVQALAKYFPLVSLIAMFAMTIVPRFIYTKTLMRNAKLNSQTENQNRSNGATVTAENNVSRIDDGFADTSEGTGHVRESLAPIFGRID